MKSIPNPRCSKLTFVDPVMSTHGALNYHPPKSEALGNNIFLVGYVTVMLYMVLIEYFKDESFTAIFIQNSHKNTI